MRWRLGDILACPECNYSPLRIIALETQQLEPDKKAFIHPCVNYCPRLDRMISESVDHGEYPCKECRNEEIIEGILWCPQCKRWYPIHKGIPHLVRDGLRIAEIEDDFLRRHAEALKHHSEELDLSCESLPPIHQTAEDKKILEEGKFWGDFFHAFVDTGDTSILDIRSPGSHPTFLNYGVRERNELEIIRKWGPWPDHLGDFLFEPLSESRGKRGLDFGCGGGQFGLEAGYRGVDMTGFDISPDSLDIARRYAQSVGLDNQYIYAEAQNLPFRTQTFNLLMSKDSLHHLSKPEEAVRKMKRLLHPDALLIVIEHTGTSKLAKAIYDFFASRLVPKIQKRHQLYDIPDILLKGAPNEDLGMIKVDNAMKENFFITREQREWMLYLRLEQLFYFAFGKRRWVSEIVRRTTYLFERAALVGYSPDHIAYIARNRK